MEIARRELLTAPTPADRAADRREKARLRSERARRARGVKPRPKAKQPWLAAGISRSTWYRRQKKAREQAAAALALTDAASGARPAGMANHAIAGRSGKGRAFCRRRRGDSRRTRRPTADTTLCLAGQRAATLAGGAIRRRSAAFSRASSRARLSGSIAATDTVSFRSPQAPIGT
jgi:hypothetical protein